MAKRTHTSISPAGHRSRHGRVRMRLHAAVAASAPASTAAEETWRGLFVAPERSCSPDNKGSDHALESMAMDRKGRGLEPTPAQVTTKDAGGGGDVITRHAEVRNDRIGRRVARRHGTWPVHRPTRPVPAKVPGWDVQRERKAD